VGVIRPPASVTVSPITYSDYGCTVRPYSMFMTQPLVGFPLRLAAVTPHSSAPIYHVLVLALRLAAVTPHSSAPIRHVLVLALVPLSLAAVPVHHSAGPLHLPLHLTVMPLPHAVPVLCQFLHDSIPLPLALPAALHPSAGVVRALTPVAVRCWLAVVLEQGWGVRALALPAALQLSGAGLRARALQLRISLTALLAVQAVQVVPSRLGGVLVRGQGVVVPALPSDLRLVLALVLAGGGRVRGAAALRMECRGLPVSALLSILRVLLAGRRLADGGAAVMVRGWGLRVLLAGLPR
jgi:hypothetical protein